MLGWLGAAAAPILIHLWMRHTHRDTRWAAMEFLREAIKRNARRLKLQQWLLLAVRTLLLLLLALAAAKPYLSGWNILTGGPQVHRILVLDGSMSMQYTAGDQSVFERAKRLAAETLDEGRPGDVYSLVVLSDPPQTIVAGPVADARRVSAQLASLEPTYGSGTLADTLTTVDTLVSEATAAQRDLAAHEVLLFTDLTAGTWRGATAGTATAEQVEKLGERAKLTVVDVGAVDPANVAVSDLRIAGTLATTVEPLLVECDITNHGPAAASDVVVQLIVGGTSVDEQTVSLPAGGHTTLSFDARFSQPGWQAVAVRTTGDNLAADDEAWLAVDVRQRVRALLVEGQPGAARYLRHALEPGGGTSPIEATVVPEGALVDTPLDDFEAIFLCNVARLTQSESELLNRYTERGGTLVFFLGDRVLPEAYNEVLARADRPQPPRTSPLLYTGDAPQMNLIQNTNNPTADEATDRLLPATIGPLKSSGTSGINPLDYQHPIAAAFRGSERAGLLSTPVSRYFELVPDEDAEVALALPTGDPLLVTAAHGRGMVAVVATSATLDTVDAATSQPWTMLPAWPSFLPIVRELVAYGIGESRGHNARTVGELLDGTLPASWPENMIRVTRPDDRTDSVPVERTSGGAKWDYNSSDRPGVYTVAAEQGEKTLAEVAVNVPVSESDLTRIDATMLPSAFTVHTATTDLGDVSGELVTDTTLHRTLLYAVLALLLIEPIMAWAFAGRAA
ncbi:BatA domain-containing protein [Aeoliella sp. ICT_H6.2]|uniref:BatA domain-containing protein n=2 Tax=Aeoliella straminimaris TaxID=2954799 RepID=A0A9X2JL13_9BACT|nr:BatA domain-containing protein [Aeoliella straminimaris]